MTMPQVLQWGVAGAFVALLLVAAGVDVAKRKIPNWTVIGLVLLFGAALLVKEAPAAWWSGLAAAAIVFVVTYILYHFNIFGAGDSKLFSAAALFIGLDHLAMFALLSVLAGGAMAVVVIAINPKRAMRGMTAAGRAEGKSRGIPYGVAIAAGAIATQALNGSLGI
jgi:prepilin peptidase CpaA